MGTRQCGRIRSNRVDGKSSRLRKAGDGVGVDKKKKNITEAVRDIQEKRKKDM